MARPSQTCLYSAHTGLGLVDKQKKVLGTRPEWGKAACRQPCSRQATLETNTTAVSAEGTRAATEWEGSGQHAH